jgi:hypothetical protein
MNELDSDLLKLFAQDEADESSDAFCTAVRQRVARQRIRNKAVKFGLIAAIAVAGAAVMVLAPEVALYPVQLVSRVLASPIAALACALGALGVAWWSRYGEA